MKSYCENWNSSFNLNSPPPHAQTTPPSWAKPHTSPSRFTLLVSTARCCSSRIRRCGVILILSPLGMRNGDAEGSWGVDGITGRGG